MMNPNTLAAGATAHRHSGTRVKRTHDQPISEEEVRRAVRAWEVKVLLEEVHAFGLRPPPGLKSVLDLFIEGRVTQTEIQAWLDKQLPSPVSSLSVEVRHA
jgi:hypothetical protein